MDCQKPKSATPPGIQRSEKRVRALWKWRDEKWNDIITKDEETPGHVRLWKRVSAGKKTEDETVVYADDTTLLRTDTQSNRLAKRLQADHDVAASYMENNKVLINPTKTQAIIITRRRNPKFRKRRSGPIPKTKVKSGNHLMEWE